MTTWTIDPAGTSAERVSLAHCATGMVARITVVGGALGTDDEPTFEVMFDYGSNKAGKFYARAEAARLYAQVCDTVGDLLSEADEPLHITDVRLHTVEGVDVMVAGHDAATVIAVYFEGATEALVDVLPNLAEAY